MNQTYNEELEKIENENIIAIEEINKLKEKRIEEEQIERGNWINIIRKK